MQVLQDAQGKAVSFNAASMQLMQLHVLQVAAQVVQDARAARVGYHVMSRLPCQAGGSAAISEANTKTISNNGCPSSSHYSTRTYTLHACIQMMAQVALVIE